jgi:predicted Rossmann-fold nucleotide-binding protein
MRIENDAAVVAVFGGNAPSQDELAAACLLGAELGRSDAVLLTGGDGSDPSTVKDAAILAADDAATPDNPAAWVGVRNAPAAAAPEPRGPRSVVVTPGGRHRRNFVEACLCDAAIAISGGPGTASEALFSLYLGRPVVIVGAASAAAMDAGALRDAALRRIGCPRRPSLGVELGICGAYAWADNPDAHAEARPLPLHADSAADLLIGLRSRISDPSPRPDFDSLVDEAAWDSYVRTALRDAGRQHERRTRRRGRGGR